MSSNSAVLEELVAAFNARDFDRAEALYGPGYVNHNPPPFAKGPDAKREWERPDCAASRR